MVASAPLSARYGAQAAWTGTEFLMTGGVKGEAQTIFRSGAAYNPTRNTWRSIAIQPPTGNAFGRAYWSGDELLVPTYHFVRREGRSRLTMLVYAADVDSWERFDYQGPAPVDFISAWTGTDVLVWGPLEGSDRGLSVGFNPDTNIWSTLEPHPVSSRYGSSVVWTGSEAIVWGGRTEATLHDDGAAYSPAADSWRSLAESPLTGRYRHAAAWSGSSMIIYGGTAEIDGTSQYVPAELLGDAAAYDASNDAWEKLPAPPLRPRIPDIAAWVGDRFVVLFGSIMVPPYDDYCFWRTGPASDGATYDSANGSWTLTPPGPLTARWGMAVALSDTDIFVWGGQGHVAGDFGALDDGALYDATTNGWRTFD